MQTQAQKEASEHNWKIFSIRGMYAAILKLDMPYLLKLELTRNLDSLLIYYGALSEQEHRRIMLNDHTYEITL
jgi:hypothetical protein